MDVQPPTPPSSSNSSTNTQLNSNNSNINSNEIPINHNSSNNSNNPKNKPFDPYAFRKNINVEPPVYKPALSPTKFKFLAGIACTVSFYLCCVSEFGDHSDSGHTTVTTGFRKVHDKVLSDFLGFDVRAKIRELEKSFFTIKDSAGNIVGDLSNVIKLGNNSNTANNSSKGNNNNNITSTETTISSTNNKKEEKKENTYLKAVTGSSSIKRTSINYNSQQERLQQLLEENSKKEKELESIVEKEVEKQLKIRQEIQNRPNNNK